MRCCFDSVYCHLNQFRLLSISISLLCVRHCYFSFVDYSVAPFFQRQKLMFSLEICNAAVLFVPEFIRVCLNFSVCMSSAIHQHYQLYRCWYFWFDYQNDMLSMPHQRRSTTYKPISTQCYTLRKLSCHLQVPLQNFKCEKNGYANGKIIQSTRRQAMCMSKQQIRFKNMYRSVKYGLKVK